MPDNVGTVLVVDDDEEMRALMHDVLQDYGHRVSVASNGREALKQLSEENYAVVLTDLRMKEMQGIELLSEIKRTFPDINVILMTAFGRLASASTFGSSAQGCGGAGGTRGCRMPRWSTMNRVSGLRSISAMPASRLSQHRMLSGKS